MAKIFSNLSLPLSSNIQTLFEDWSKVGFDIAIGNADSKYEILSGGEIVSFFSEGSTKKEKTFVYDPKQKISWLTEIDVFTETQRKYIPGLAIPPGTYPIKFERLDDADLDWHLEFELKINNNAVEQILPKPCYSTPALERLWKQALEAEKQIKESAVWYRRLWNVIKYYVHLLKKIRRG